eukprot:CFRG7007T1
MAHVVHRLLHLRVVPRYYKVVPTSLPRIPHNEVGSREATRAFGTLINNSNVVTPISSAEFAASARACGLSPKTNVVIALSGGSDSMCLASLSAKFFNDITAVTVDHRLRPDSGEEAEKVSQMMSRLNVRHTIIKIEWEESKHGREPNTSIQQKARVERYRLLSEYCRTLHKPVLLTGHNINDQAETFIMRLIKGSGVDGLASIARLKYMENPRLTVARPLLSFEKKRIVSTLIKQKLPWVEDPSNAKMYYERNRVRRELQLWYDTYSHVTPQALARLADDAFCIKSIYSRKVHTWLSQNSRYDHMYGYLEIQDISSLLELPWSLRRRIYVRLYHIVAGPSRYPPSTKQIVSLDSLLKEALDSTPGFNKPHSFGKCSLMFQAPNVSRIHNAPMRIDGIVIPSDSTASSTEKCKLEIAVCEDNVTLEEAELLEESFMRKHTDLDKLIGKRTQLLECIEKRSQSSLIADQFPHSPQAEEKTDQFPHTHSSQLRLLVCRGRPPRTERNYSATLVTGKPCVFDDRVEIMLKSTGNISTDRLPLQVKLVTEGEFCLWKERKRHRHISVRQEHFYLRFGLPMIVDAMGVVVVLPVLDYFEEHSNVNVEVRWITSESWNTNM